jgi:RimJ/RimL family protein N-acetyltransferase
MPTEQLSEENFQLTPERYEEQCENNLQEWEHFLSFVAIEKKTGDPVGFTVSVITDYQPHVAWQWETGVVPEHRGNGLGLALKYQMLERLLKETGVKYWSTGSASVNIHMHKINELLGYKKWNSEIVYEFTKKELRDFIERLEIPTS